ncbi:recombinase family protein [Chloroflexota bacterium]
MVKRAVLYARVSGDDRGKDGRNLEGQLEMCRTHAAKYGWPIVAELAEDDRGASGASFELPQLNRVYEMAQARDFDVLVVREIDRLSRKLAKQLIVEEELKRQGIQIEYVMGEYPDTPEGNLMKNVKASIAEYERLKITERMVRGRRQKVKAGHIMTHGRSPYGYHLGQRDGKTALVINEQEAQVVQMIFAWYGEGSDEHGPLSLRNIAHELQKMGIPTPDDTHSNRRKQKVRGWGEWSVGSIANILKNETYSGVWRYGSEPKIPVEVPTIVPPETWRKVQARREINRRNSRRNTQYEYLMGRRLYCAVCGSKIAGRPSRKGESLYLYYACQARYNFARTCTLKTYFRSELVDEAVWEWIKSFLNDPAELVEGFRAYQEDRERENAPLRERLFVVSQLLDENRTQLDRLLDLYLSGDFPKDLLTERKNLLETTVAALNQERTSLTNHLEAQILTDDEMQSLQAFAAQVANGMDAAEQDFETRREIIELLNVEGTLAVEDEQKVIYVRCMLGDEELSIASKNTCSRSSRRMPECPAPRRPASLPQPPSRGNPRRAASFPARIPLPYPTPCPAGAEGAADSRLLP